MKVAGQRYSSCPFSRTTIYCRPHQRKRGVGVNRTKKCAVLLLTLIFFMTAGCGGIKLRVRTGPEEPLKEFRLEGKEEGKVLVVPIRGFISDAPRRGLLGERPSMVQEVVSQLRKAEKDEEVKAVLLEINSPGGTTTASDILFHEIMLFKERTKAKVVAALMDVAASGGYYVALSGDHIIAHPTTITGSVGVIFVVPKVTGLMDKVGVTMQVSKSGAHKDLTSPFRESTPEEQRMLQEMTDDMARTFLSLVTKRRPMEAGARDRVATGSIYLAEEALRLKLIDSTGYLRDGLSTAKKLAGLPDDAKVVVYRRTKYENDTIYNTSMSAHGSPVVSLVDFNLSDIIPALGPGFYYLWMPGSYN